MLLGIGILAGIGESGDWNRGDVLTLVCGVSFIKEKSFYTSKF